MDPKDELEFLRGFLGKKYRHVFGKYKKLLEKEIQARGTSTTQTSSGTDGALLAPPPPTVDVALEQRKAAALAAAMNGPCSCLKSRCIVLYCTCFNQGIGCRSGCKCKNCENPKGAVDNSAPPTVKKKKKSQMAKAISAVAGGSDPLQGKDDSQSLLMLTVSPGILGITLSMISHDEDGGAAITRMDPECLLTKHLQVGDRIVSIDGEPVTSLQDFVVVVGEERQRKFGILKKSEEKLIGEIAVPAAANMPTSSAAAAAAAGASALTTANNSAPLVPQGIDSKSLLLLTVTPGRLGLTLSLILDDVVGGAEITRIDKECTFLKQVKVGDRILTIDGTPVTKLQDFLVTDKTLARKFGILKKADVATKIAENAKVASSSGEDKGSLAAPTAATTQNCESSDSTRKQTFAMDRLSDRQMMSDLLQWDRKNNKATQVQLGMGLRHQVLCVPLRRNEKVNKRELDNKCFHEYNHRTGFFDQFLDAWASYCDGTQEDAAKMILFYMAKRYPQCYVQNFELATEMYDKQINESVLEEDKSDEALPDSRSSSVGKQFCEIPRKFVSYDGTNDVKWNMNYGELIEYQKEHGDCKVHSRTDLGRWVGVQRSNRAKQSRSLSDTRIQLLDKLGFSWSGLREGCTISLPSGDPRKNRAMAAKLMFPDLTVREALRLGGFEEEELDVVCDAKHKWRTVYVSYKDRIVSQIAKFETMKRGGRLQIDQFLSTLKGEEEDRFEQVFQDKSHLLPGFLEAAEERRRNGIVETHRSRNGKRKRDESLNAQADDVDRADDDAEEYDESENDNEVDEDDNEEIDDEGDDTVQHDIGRQHSYYWRYSST